MPTLQRDRQPFSGVAARLIAIGLCWVAGSASADTLANYNGVLAAGAPGSPISLPIAGSDSRKFIASSVDSGLQSLSSGGSNVDVTVVGVAEHGRLRVSGVATSHTVDTAGGSGGDVTAVVSAGWNDGITLSVAPGVLGPSGLATLTSLLIVTGSTDATGVFANGFAPIGQGRALVSVQGTGIADDYRGCAALVTPIPGLGSLGCRAVGQGNLGWLDVIAVLPFIPVRFDVLPGVKTTINYAIALRTSADTVSSGVCDLPGSPPCGQLSASASASGQFSRTILWDGMIATNEFGQEIPFTVTSDSGFDYAQPFPIPEPGFAVSVSVSTLGLVILRGRSAKRIHRV